jgi:serine/threonine-protein kinase
MLGETIGQYRIEKKLGEGGVGEVFRAVDLMLRRAVAVKRLRPELSSREDVAERFLSEAQTLALLNHPNIATLYAFERQGESLFMVMEYVEGETISSLVRRRGPLPPSTALPLFAQALDGIGYAHERGIVHRDIKGSNLILTPDEVVKVMDFGIARVLGSERMTLMGQLVGTPEYMSPEQIRGEETDARADIYALGVLLYMLLAGRLPFTARSDFDLMRAKVESPPPPLTRFAPELPEGLEEAIQGALATDPRDRIESTAAFREALSPLLAASEGPTGDSSPAPVVRLAQPEEAPAAEIPKAQPTRVMADRESEESAPSEPPCPAEPSPAIEARDDGDTAQKRKVEGPTRILEDQVVGQAETTALEDAEAEVPTRTRSRPLEGPPSASDSRLSLGRRIVTGVALGGLLIGLNILWTERGTLPPDRPPPGPRMEGASAPEAAFLERLPFDAGVPAPQIALPGAISDPEPERDETANPEQVQADQPPDPTVAKRLQPKPGSAERKGEKPRPARGEGWNREEGSKGWVIRRR